MRMRFVSIFCWIIGIFGLYVAISIFISGEERALLTDFHNPVLRYAAPLILINLSAVLLLYPLLLTRGTGILDYSAADKYMRAKTTVVLLSLSAPAWLLLFIGARSVSDSSTPSFVFGGILLFWYFSSIVTILKGRHESENERN
jgi:hypothetical protein